MTLDSSRDERIDIVSDLAALGGVGTISSVDPRRVHPDLMQRTRELHFGDQIRSVTDLLIRLTTPRHAMCA